MFNWRWVEFFPFFFFLPDLLKKYYVITYYLLQTIYIFFYVPIYCVCVPIGLCSPDDWHHLLGANSRLGDGLSGRRRLLPCLQCHRVGGQRGKRSPLHAIAGPNDTAEHPGNQEPPRDPQWPREHIRIHADCSWRSHYRLGHQGGTSRNVRLTALKLLFFHQ